MNNKPRSVLCVMDAMGLTPMIQLRTPRHIAVEYMMECVLILIENATSETAIRNYQHLAMEYIDEMMDNYDYEEAMSRGMTDDEYISWLELVMGEVVECAMDIAKTMFQQIKPVLTTCEQMYPGGYVMDVLGLETDGLYTDLTEIPPSPPSGINGLSSIPNR